MIETKYASSHPSTAERFVALEKAAEEIKGKIASGLPLTPREKDDSSIPVQAREREKLSPTEEGKKGKHEQVAAISGDKRPVVVEPIKLRDRAERDFGDQDLEKMVKTYNFFSRQFNPGGNFNNDFADNGDGTITDKATTLMWQKAGSPSDMTFYEIQKYLDELNSSVTRDTGTDGCRPWKSFVPFWKQPRTKRGSLWTTSLLPDRAPVGVLMRTGTTS